MAGIYVHVPFCRQACHYCNFHFSTSLQWMNDFVEALLKEIDSRREYLYGEPIETVYFGGGTPSLLTEEQLNHIVARLQKNFSISAGAEFTLEANPDDINKSKLESWRALGVNRLSLGVQSFVERDLRWMNRAHSAQEAIASIQESQDAGFDNISMDLIYGVPMLTDNEWRANLTTAMQLKVHHLSCYALTVEPKTPLASFIGRHLSPPVDPDAQAIQFEMLTSWAKIHGFEHYEISNFARPGFRSRHNSAYWKRTPYIGLGPSAHSFRGSERRWNVANNALYIQSAKAGEIVFEEEHLTKRDTYNEMLMTGLRMSDGLDLRAIATAFGEEIVHQLLKDANPKIAAGLMEKDDDHLRLTNTGRFLADGIAADLFADSN
jgi:oxygen-independent coproporphyrinogen III oxidase